MDLVEERVDTYMEPLDFIVESIDVFVGLEKAARNYGIRGCRTHAYTGLAQRTHDDVRAGYSHGSSTISTYRERSHVFLNHCIDREFNSTGRADRHP